MKSIPTLLIFSFLYFEISAQADITSSFPLSAEVILSDYIKYRSLSGSEREAGEYFSNISHELGLHITYFGKVDGNYNFAASMYPLALNKPNIVFLNHIDVVPEGYEKEWNLPPFGGVIENGEIWGRGSFDNKGIGVMQLMAVAEFSAKHKNEDLPYNITMLSVSCEETQCDGGAKYVADNHLLDLNPAVIIGEGPPALDSLISTNLDEVIFGIATANKRSFWVELTLNVASVGHGSVTPLVYANKEMVAALSKLLSKKEKAVYTPENRQLLKNLGKLEKGIKRFILRNPRLFKPLIMSQLRKKPEIFSVFSNTVTLTQLSSQPNACNVVPATIRACLDCRLLPQTDEKEFLRKIIKRLGNPAIQISVRDSSPKMPVSSSNSVFFQHMKTAIEEYHGDVNVFPIILPNLNDSGAFRNKGVLAFDIIPARIPNYLLYKIHGYNERLPLKTLYSGIEVFKLFLEKTQNFLKN
jgi:acetylornithine deacetylase/succinyl-diaminopimelate desuccinylase-like protein